ncbi:MAG: alpha-L-fucosidase [Fimbriimonas sp.]
MLLIACALLAGSPLPTPTPRQLAWQATKTNAFVHFGPNTFTDVEWGGGKEDPNLFNPTALDCDQWVRAFKAAGFKGVILTAKHHDGFCLWPSKLSTHTVAQSKWRGGKGDVLRELADACRRGGLKLGVYLSPWDRNHPAYGTPEYNAVFAKMLEETLTQYGPIFEVWFDGANGEGPNGKRQVYDWDLFIRTVRRHQPNAVIFSDSGPDVRWIGNEEGRGGETCWSTIPSGRYHPGTPFYAELTEGKRGADLWVPAEVNTSIRPGWFYHADQDGKVKSPQRLMELYEASVGRNGVFLLNIPPDRRGRLADPDVRSLEEFGRLRRTVYDRDLAKGARMKAESGSVNRNRWEAPEGSSQGSVAITLPKAATFDRVELREPIAEGQRIASFVVEARDSASWREIARGTTVGYNRILKTPLTTASELRVRVDDALAAPILLPLHLYRSVVDETVTEGTAKLDGRQNEDGSLTLTAPNGSRELGPDQSIAWRFEARRGEVLVELEATGDADVRIDIGGQTLRGRLQGGRLRVGKAAIVVGGPTPLTVRVEKGKATIRAVRLRAWSASDG